ncbi:MAG: MATE family efflux transporter [Pseudomonadota bacterium]|nr:MATE family efflux transporter [Pseudomonadota bacterium]
MTATPAATESANAETRPAAIWRLAWPVILSNATVPLVGLVDTAIMGHFPDPAFIGGVALGGLIFSYVYWGFGFLRMATTGLAAQASGGGDVDELRAVLARALLIAALAGLICVGGGRWLADLALWLLSGRAAVEEQARLYFTIRVLAAPAALANTAVLGWLFGIRAMGGALIQQLTVNAANILFNLLFVFGLGLDVDGVAWASVAAQYLGLAVSIHLLRHHLRRVGGGFDRPRILAAKPLTRLFKINLDIFIRTLAVISGTALFMDASAAADTVVLAANAVLLNLQTLAAHGLDGFAHATESLVGRAIGARAPARLAAAVRNSSVMALALGAAIGLTYFVAGGWIIAALTTIDAVRASALIYLPWAAAAPVISVAAFQLDGIFIGATRSREMRDTMVLSLFAFWAALQVTGDLAGTHGLWFAYVLFLGLRGAALALYYPRVRALTAGEAAATRAT